MRVSSPTLHARRDEAMALDELLERVEQLGDAYGHELLDAVEPWVERAREVASADGSARELRRVRDAIEEQLLSAACARADDLMEEHGRQIDGLVARSGMLGTMATDLAAVIIDPQSPDVPAELCARPWPVSIERREELARELEGAAPNTAEALREPPSTIEHDVVVVTLGRVLRTTRRVRGAGSA